VGQYGKDSLFTDTHYAFVVTDRRGRYASKSAEVPGGQQATLGAGWIRHDRLDGQAGLVQRESCHMGRSALAAAQYETARENPPALVCSVPIVMTLAARLQHYFPGGVLWNEFAATLGKLGWSVYDKLTLRPIKDESWANVRTALVQGEDIRVPMLFIGGWFDIYTDGVMSGLRPGADAGPRRRALRQPAGDGAVGFTAPTRSTTASSISPAQRIME